MIDVSVIRAKISSARDNPEIVITARALEQLLGEVEAGRDALARLGETFASRGRTL